MKKRNAQVVAPAPVGASTPASARAPSPLPLAASAHTLADACTNAGARPRLAPRDGVGPSVVSLPREGGSEWPTVLDFLESHFPAISRRIWLQRIVKGDVVDEFGMLVTEDRPFQDQLRVYYFREVRHEEPIPFKEVILHQDEHLIVVDKPHFLPVTPSGQYLQETVLVRLKRKLGLDDLVPIHRIDRDTAGLVLFSIQPKTRNAYQALFRERAVHKSYEAIAPWRPELDFPLSRRSRIVSGLGFMTQREEEGEPNTLTHIEVLGVHGSFARYGLTPVTGKRHQLRVHMNALGMPIVGDGIYPVLTPEGQADYAKPLQLLAKSIGWTDPISNQWRQFESRFELHLH